MASRFNLDPNVSLAGCLLVASPNWQHELFGRAVCLVVHHGAQGAIGVVLNRHLPLPIGELLKQLSPDEPIRSDARLHLGGPQAGPVVALHNRQELAEFTSAEGVYFAAQVQNLQQLVSSSSVDTQVKIIVGQADWAAGELDSEFASGKWLPLPVSSALVFADDSEMWGRAMHGVGDLFVANMTGARARPIDVLTN